MFFRAVLSFFLAASAALMGSVVFLSLGTPIVALDLSVPRVPVNTSISAETGCIPRPFITSLDTFFARRKTLFVVLLRL
jgi:hypothetical protein